MTQVGGQRHVEKLWGTEPVTEGCWTVRQARKLLTSCGVLLQEMCDEYEKWQIRKDQW